MYNNEDFKDKAVAKAWYAVCIAARSHIGFSDTADQLVVQDWGFEWQRAKEYAFAVRPGQPGGAAAYCAHSCCGAIHLPCYLCHAGSAA